MNKSLLGSLLACLTAALCACSGSASPETYVETEDSSAIVMDFLDRRIPYTDIDRETGLKIECFGPETRWIYHARFQGTAYRCFHCREELEGCGLRNYVADWQERDGVPAGIYETEMARLPEIDWEHQTLVLVHGFSATGLRCDGCKVFEKGGRYTIRLALEDTLVCACDDVGFAIILNEGGVGESRIELQRKGH